MATRGRARVRTTSSTPSAPVAEADDDDDDEEEEEDVFIGHESMCTSTLLLDASENGQKEQIFQFKLS